MRNTIQALVLALPFGFATPAMSATFDVADIMSSFGLIALNNLTAASESEVPAYVGGNLSSNGYTVNGKGYADGTIGGVSGALIVGGTVSGNDVNVNNGNAQVGAVTGKVNTNAGSLTTGVSIDTASVTSAFQTLSDDLSTLSDTADASADASDRNQKSLNGGTPDAEGISVLTANASFLGSGTLSSFTMAGGSSLIVNVAGTDINITGNFNQDSNNVIFNFYEAEKVTVNSTFGFGILAAYADVHLNSGGTDTFVVGNNIFQTTEVRGTYAGALPSAVTEVAPVPLPASGLLLIGAIASAAGLRRRAKKAA